MKLDTNESFDNSTKNTVKFLEDLQKAIGEDNILKARVRDMALQTGASDSLNAHVYIDNDAGLWTVDIDELEELDLVLRRVDNSFMPTQECEVVKMVIDRV